MADWLNLLEDNFNSKVWCLSVQSETLVRSLVHWRTLVYTLSKLEKEFASVSVRLVSRLFSQPCNKVPSPWRLYRRVPLPLSIPRNQLDQSGTFTSIERHIRMQSGHDVNIVYMYSFNCCCMTWTNSPSWITLKAVYVS